jgi:hypothetical protein
MVQNSFQHRSEIIRPLINCRRQFIPFGHPFASVLSSSLTRVQDNDRAYRLDLYYRLHEATSTISGKSQPPGLKLGAANK